MDVDEPQNTSDSVTQGWSNEDKYYLLQAIKCSHSNSIENIKTLLTTKSEKEIEETVKYYKKRAANHPFSTKTLPPSRRALKKISRAPIAMWAKYLTDLYSYKELEAETSLALHLLADLDDIPAGVCTSGVDFKEIYHGLANAMEGKSLPVDKTINMILEKCILESAYAGKAFIRRTSFLNVLNAIYRSDKEINVFRPTEKLELDAVRHLSSQRQYNPLNVSETYLKPTYRSNLDMF